MRDGNGVRQERSGWRCQAISERHRKWGYNCPAVDLDFVVAEYNHGKPVALVEYKEKSYRAANTAQQTYAALAALADGYIEGPIPFLIAIYDPVDWWFRVQPVNERAREYYKHCIDEALSEQRFVRSLYLMRKRVLNANDEAAINALSTAVPAASWEKGARESDEWRRQA